VVLSKREKYIGIGVAAAVAVAGLYQFVITPFMDQSNQVDSDMIVAKRQLDDDSTLFARKKKLEKVWKDMQNGGLKSDQSEADAQAQHALVDWAQRTQVNVTSLKSEHAAQEGQFQVLSYEITGTATTPTLAHLISALETASIPLRVNEVQLSSRPEHSDNLQIRLTVSTLLMPPQADNSSKTPPPPSSDGEES
jgi:hypothetical protein